MRRFRRRAAPQPQSQFPQSGKAGHRMSRLALSTSVCKARPWAGCNSQHRRLLLSSRFALFPKQRACGAECTGIAKPGEFPEWHTSQNKHVRRLKPLALPPISQVSTLAVPKSDASRLGQVGSSPPHQRLRTPTGQNTKGKRSLTWPSVFSITSLHSRQKISCP